MDKHQWDQLSVVQKKDALLAMARTDKSRDGRPKTLTPEGMSLSRYTSKSQSSYDKGFTSQLFEIAPEWKILRRKRHNYFRLVKAFFDIHGRLPSTVSLSKVERSMGNWINQCRFVGGRYFSADVAAWAASVKPLSMRVVRAKRGTPVKCVNTGEVFESQSAAARAHGLFQMSVKHSVERGTPTRKSGLLFTPVEADERAS